MNEIKKTVTKLDSGAATPINVSKEMALSYASKQDDVYRIVNEKELKKEENYEKAIGSNSYIQPKKVEEKGDLICLRKPDFVIVEGREKKNPLVYIIMILILLSLITIFIVFELPMLRGL